MKELHHIPDREHALVERNQLGLPGRLDVLFPHRDLTTFAPPERELVAV